MAWRQPILGPSRAGGKRDDRLRDEVPRIVTQLLGELAALLRSCPGSHQHAVTARLVDRLDHQLGKVIEHVGQVIRTGADVRGNVLENRLLAEIEADHVLDKRIDCLVVGHSGADGVGERHVASSIRFHQIGNTEHRVGPEALGIEEVVVEPAVDHIHPLGPAGRAQKDLLVMHEQILPEDQLDAHVAGQEAMLEIG